MNIADSIEFWFIEKWQSLQLYVTDSAVMSIVGTIINFIS